MNPTYDFRDRVAVGAIGALLESLIQGCVSESSTLLSQDRDMIVSC